MKKNKNKSKSIYRILSSITLIAPLPIYLILMSVLFGITPDYVIFTDIDNVEVVEFGEDYFLTTKNNASMNGLVEFRDNKYGIIIDEKDIIKIDKKYYSYVLKDEIRQLVDIKQIETQKQQSYKIPTSIFISFFAILIVVLIIQNKMQWHKKHPRIAVLTALLTGTVILFIINEVIGNILGVFLVSTASWAVYCLEYLVYSGSITEKEKEKKESDILTALKGLLE